MCCSTIRVTLNGVVKDIKRSRAGTYQKTSGLINNRSHWNKIDGDHALWYNNNNNVWMIGSSRYLGSRITDGIHSFQDTACPKSDCRFKYHSGSGEWALAPINSVSIQCV